ncbi:MAG: transketolase-like TK C-terminal-containing protein, partial [Pseudonocardiaceae bacterium]
PAQVTLCAVGALVSEALAAAGELERAGVGVEVVCLTSPDLIFRAVRARQSLQAGDWWILDRLFAPSTPLPVVGIIDGHPHALAFLGAIRDTPSTSLGVSEFGQSGDIAALCGHYGIDVETIIGAALDLISG